MTSPNANGVTHPHVAQSPPLQPVVTSSVPTIPSPPTSPRKVTFWGVIGRLIVTLLALMFAAASVGTNATYAVSQGTSAENQFWLGVYSVSYELAIVAMPLAIAYAWSNRRPMYWLASIGALLICLMASVYGAAGFMASNFGDSAAARQASQKQRAALQGDLDRARADRTRITVIPTTQAAIDAAREAIPKGCTRVNETDDCKARRKKHADLLDHQANAEQHDKLTAQITRLEGVLSQIQAGKVADPQIETVILLLTRFGPGWLVINSQDAELLRLLTFIFLPLLAGLFLEWAWGDVLSERRTA